MGLEAFMKQDSNREKVERIFQRGVRVIYEEAFSFLSSDSLLMDKLLAMDKIPSEITSTFLHNLKNNTYVAEKDDLFQNNTKLDGQKYRALKTYLNWDPVTPGNFISHFTYRYRALSQLLWKRPQMKNTISISQISRIKTREELSIIGMVRNIRENKDGRRFLTVEDLSGSITILIPTTIPERGDIVCDEVIGIKGFPGTGGGILFANAIFFPEITPITWPVGERPYAVFISDLHVGSKKFMVELWERFISWLKEHKEVKYVFIAGDVVDGVGMYYKQNEHLDIETVEEQMEVFAKYMKQIRHDVKIFVISGNHDPNRDSEPQPVFPEVFGKPLKKIDNLEVYSNPSWIDVEGINILMYHGTSFDGVIDAIESIRNNAYHRPYLAQIQLLKKRHLSPIFGKNKIFPDKQDFMVINKVPHVFHTGHIHNVSLSSYKGVKLVSSGTFQNITDFQEKLGHEPTPGQFIVMNLSDGNSKIIDFSRIQ